MRWPGEESETGGEREEPPRRPRSRERRPLSTLPESLRDLPTFGPYALLWAALWIALASSSSRSPAIVSLLLIAVVVPFGFVLSPMECRRQPLGLSGLGRVHSGRPSGGECGGRVRCGRPTDLCRDFRSGASRSGRREHFPVHAATMILFRDKIDRPSVRAGQLQWFGLVESLLVVGAAIATVGGLVWAYRRGCPGRETAGFCSARRPLHRGGRRPRSQSFSRRASATCG